MHLFIPAAGGLAEAHRNGIVHRDVKPGTMFVVAPRRAPQRLALLDIGIARLGDDAELTQTPGYMAPEVLAGAPGSVAVAGVAPTDASATSNVIPAELDDVLVRTLDGDASADEVIVDLARVNLTWSGASPIDRMTSSPSPRLHGEPTDAPATQVEARRAETV